MEDVIDAKEVVEDTLGDVMKDEILIAVEKFRRENPALPRIT